MAYLENIKTFVRVYELGNMSAAARDQRISAAVASARILQLEEHLNVRLFQRTTRSLHPTEQGTLFYAGACRILETIEDAEAEISSVTKTPRGTLLVAAPLGVGRRLIAPAIPAFKQAYPLINIRLRLSDRKLELAAEGIDVAFFLGVPEDSNLRIRKIADCKRVICAAPSYLACRGVPETAMSLGSDAHDCLNLRYPGASEYHWPMQTPEGVKLIPVTGPFESDVGDVLTNWALEGYGLVLKPEFDVTEHLASGALVRVLENEPPVPVQMACLYTHRRWQDPKARLLIDFMVSHIQSEIGGDG